MGIHLFLDRVCINSWPFPVHIAEFYGLQQTLRVTCFVTLELPCYFALSPVFLLLRFAILDGLMD